MSDHITIPDGHKRCSKCGEIKPRVEFYKDRRKRDGFQHCCKKCHAKINRLWVERNPEKVREADRRWKERNPEKAREIGSRWKERNREKQREYARLRREQNPEKSREADRLWRERHPEKAKASWHNRRARKLSAPGHYTVEDIRLQVRAQTDKKGRLICWWCGKSINGEHHIDHRIPLDKGGTNYPGNLVIAHKHCNLKKSDKLPWQFNGRLL